MKTIKDIYDEKRVFLTPFSDDVNTDVAKFLPIIDEYIYSNFYRVLVDEITYNSFLPFFLKAHKFEFERVYNAINAEYNPIDNYNMKEESDRIINNATETKETTQTGERTTARNEKGSLSVTNENSESVIDTDDMKLSNISTTTTTPENYGSETIEKFDNFKTTETKSYEAPVHETNLLKRSGNIGVTTTQQMIQSTIELEKYNTFVQYVTFKFINELTMGVYCYD